MELNTQAFREAIKRGTSHMKTTKPEKKSYCALTVIQPSRRSKLLPREVRQKVFDLLVARGKMTVTSICMHSGMDRKAMIKTLVRWQELSIIERLVHSTYYQPLVKSLPANDV